jgi:hypothetical protein
VQWHPEAGADPALFDALIEAAMGGPVLGAPALGEAAATRAR